MHRKFVWILFFASYCTSQLTLPTYYPLEHDFANCVANITDTYLDFHQPIVLQMQSPYNRIIRDNVVQALQIRNNFPLIILGNTARVTNRIRPGAFIIMLPVVYDKSDVYFIHEMLKKSSNINLKAKIILVLSWQGGTTNINDKTISLYLLEKLSRYGYVNTLILDPVYEGESVFTNNINILSWEINEQSEFCSELDKIKHLDTWLCREKTFIYNTNLFPTSKNVDLRGCKLNVVAYPLYPFANNCPNHYCGTISHILMSIIKDINVTLLDFRKGSHNQIDVLLPIIMDAEKLSDCVFSYPYFFLDLIWYVPTGREIPRWQSLFRTFNSLTWFLIILTFCFGCLTMWLLEMSPSHRANIATTANTAFAITALLCHLGVGVADKYKGVIATTFFSLWLYYCFIINTAYQSAIFGLLVDPGRYEPIQTYKELLHSDLVMERLFVLSEDRGYIYWEKYGKTYPLCGDSVEQCFRKLSDSQSHALLAYTDMGNTLSNYFKDKRGIPTYEALSEVEGTAFYTIKFSRWNCILHSSFEKICQGFYSAGIIDHLNKLMKWTYKMENREPEAETIFAFSLYHLQGAFYLLLIGLSVSLLMYIAEIITHSISN
ncbi:Ionotropic receptor 905 [Blattella germanica]|nr:Ionotropic receptor 905 [Blattella germanica]